MGRSGVITLAATPARKPLSAPTALGGGKQAPASAIKETKNEKRRSLSSFLGKCIGAAPKAGNLLGGEMVPMVPPGPRQPPMLFYLRTVSRDRLGPGSLLSSLRNGRASLRDGMPSRVS